MDEIDQEMEECIKEELNRIYYAELKAAHETVVAAGITQEVAAKSMIYGGLVILAAKKDMERL